MNKRLLWLIVIFLLLGFLFPKEYNISYGFISNELENTKWCLGFSYEYYPYPPEYRDAPATHYCFGIPLPK